MANEAREIIAFQEGQLRQGNDKFKEMKLGALRVVSVAVDHAERLGALPASLPQFSRVIELIQGRTELTPQEQMLASLGYTPDQVAHHLDNITESTKVYAGSLVHPDAQGGFVRIFERLGNVERVFAPEGEIKVQELTIGGKKKDQLQKELRQGHFKVSQWTKDIMEGRGFTTLDDPQTIKVVKMPIKALGFDKRSTPTTEQIYKRAGLLGLDLCDAEVGPHQRLQDTAQPMNDWYWIAMEQITASHGLPRVFGLARHADGIWLLSAWARPGTRWFPEYQMVFSLRK